MGAGGGVGAEGIREGTGAGGVGDTDTAGGKGGGLILRMRVQRGRFPGESYGRKPTSTLNSNKR